MAKKKRKKDDVAGKALDDARNHFSEGDFAAALERYEWFFHHALEFKQAYYGVRLSYVLSEWKELGEKYPPAMEALLAVQEDKLRQVRSGNANAETFHDYWSITEYLKQVDDGLAVFQELDKLQPNLAVECIRFVDERLLFRQPTLFLQYTPQIEEYVRRQWNNHVELRDIHAQRVPPFPWSMKGLDRKFFAICRQAAKVADGIPDPKQAAAIRAILAEAQATATWKVKPAE